MAAEQRSVLVCIDESDHAERAFEYYAENIWRENDIVVLGFIPELYDYDFASPKVIQQLVGELAEKCRILEEKYKKKMEEHNFSGKFKTGKGKPGDALFQMAKDESVSLVVIGSRGQGKVRRTLMGSVSSDVLHHSHVPVLVCK